jgi:hypothetical protein
MGISSRFKEDDEDVDWEDTEGVESDSTTITSLVCGESGLPLEAYGTSASDVSALSSWTHSAATISKPLAYEVTKITA